jgi:hypothetical protein
MQAAVASIVFAEDHFIVELPQGVLLDLFVTELNIVST